MVGGAFEMVMGAQFLSGNTTIATANSGFGAGVLDNTDMNKYIDKYIYGTTFNNPTAYARSKLGDAMGEVVFSVDRSWDSDYARMPYSTLPWITRGGGPGWGDFNGLMTYRHTDGSNIDQTTSFRIVIINQ